MQLVQDEINRDMLRTERLTLAVLLSGVAALALSDFVSPIYWFTVAIVAALRLWRGTDFALTEMQASMIGWVGFVWVGLELLLGRAWAIAFSDFMLILALAVIVEAATPRNHLHRLLTATFLILAAAVLTDSFLFVLPLAAWLWFMWRSAACLYAQGLHEQVTVPTVRSDLHLILWLVIGAAILFVTIPRFDAHSALTGVQPRMKTGGFSDQVTLGSFARSLDARVAFRVESINTEPKEFRKRMMGRYWRGITLSRYDGHSWQRQKSATQTYWQRRGNLTLSKATNKDMRVAVYREASDHAYVFLPDGLQRIERLPFRGQLDVQGNARFKHPPSRRIRLLMMLSHQRLSSIQLSTPIAAERDRSHTPAQVRQWIATILGTTNNADMQSLFQLQQNLKTWTYDLNATIDEQHPIVSFMQQRRGHCELYATLMALAARELGIPARVVNGYYGGDWNESGQFLIIRQQQAHSWTEVWLNGRWQRLDATPPSRWSLSAIRFPQVDDLWENVRLAWYRYVLQFQDDDRMRVFTQIITWLQQILPRLLFLISLAVAIGWAWLQWKKRRPKHHLNAQWRLLDRWLLQHDVQRKPWQPLRLLATPKGIAAKDWQHWLQQWEAQCYQPSISPWTLRQLRKKLRQLKKNSAA